MNKPTEGKNYQDLIIKVRNYWGMTQPQFGKMFDLSAQIISHYEKGTRKPNKEVKSFVDNFLKKICICDKCNGKGWLLVDKNL